MTIKGHLPSVDLSIPLFQNVAFVFLDRDGVINADSPDGSYITNTENLHLLLGASSSITRLNTSGRKVIVVTNQRGISLGLITEYDLGLIHERLRTLLNVDGATLDAIYYCPHDKGECECRKPKTGMLKNAFFDFPEANARNSILIGNSLSDIECANAAGMRSIFIEGEPRAFRDGFEAAILLADATAPSLEQAVSLIL